MLDKLKFIIFDADGTLMESREFCRYLLKKILDLSSNSLIRQFYLITLKEQHCPELVLILWKKLNFFIYEISEKLEKPPRLFEGVREFLEKLSENHVKMFVSTAGSKSLRIEKKLQELGILNFFDMVLGREFSKQEHVSLFAEHLGIEQNKFCKETLFFSDGLEDMCLAQRLNIYSVGVTSTFNAEMLKEFGAKRVVANFEELTELYLKILLKEINKKAHQVII